VTDNRGRETGPGLFLRGLLLGALAGWFVFYVVGVR